MEFDTNLYSKIRSAVGGPNTTELDDTEIEDALRETIQYMNGIIDHIVIRSFQTVEDQQLYSIHANTKRVLDVIQELPVQDLIIGDATASIDLGGAEFSVTGPMSGSGISFFRNPSLFTSWSRKLHHWRKVSERTWQFVDSEDGAKKLWLIPPPGDTGDYVVYFSAEAWDESNIPTDWEYLVKMGARAEILDRLAAKRWSEAGVSRAGGIVNYNAPGNLIDLAEKIRKRFRNEVFALSMKYNSIPSYS